VNIAIDRKALKEITIGILGTESPTRVAIAFVPFANLTAKREKCICVRTKWHIFDAIPIVVPARWITQIPVVFVLPEQFICWWSSGAVCLSKHSAPTQHQN
jgi:hypothetical protein